MTDYEDVTEVTEVEPFDEERLRGALEYVLRFDVAHEGSLYLRALACCYLSAPHESEPVLSDEYHAQAEREGTHPDDLLLQLVGLALETPGGAS